jgi:hypothetical protein
MHSLLVATDPEYVAYPRPADTSSPRIHTSQSGMSLYKRAGIYHFVLIL